MFFLVVVSGVSMVPMLAPGDRLLVRRVRHPSDKLVGRIVVARDPRDDGILVIKRFASFNGDSFALIGDNSGASTDSRTLGSFPSNTLLGQVVYRYFPVNAAGRIR
ncbi:MAG: nickel-type superoxide dismutase maturation protease [Acidimicrobiaceae bacterium]|nr:nickel-type superoxide dismutase maturation protease [Acidimicrobiaceae bacterium]